MVAHILAGSLKGPVCEQICGICHRQSINKGFFNVIFLKAQCREIVCDFQQIGMPVVGIQIISLCVASEPPSALLETAQSLKIFFHKYS
jgi:hypothetical protein